MTKDDLEQPDTTYYIIGFIPLQLTVQSKAIKYDSCKNGLHQVIGKCHLPDRYENAEEYFFNGSRLIHQYQQAEVTNCLKYSPEMIVIKFPLLCKKIVVEF